MPQYVDGFVLTVPKKNKEAYIKIAKKAGKIWMEHGALAYYETLGDDMKVPFGIPFTKIANAKSTDLVVFSWIVYKSKKHRDAVNKKVMADERMHKGMEDMPFDCDKMTYGGFETVVKY